MDWLLKVFLFCSEILAFPQIHTCSLSLFLTVNDTLRHLKSIEQEFRRPGYGTLSQSSGELTFSFVIYGSNPHEWPLRSLPTLMDCDLNKSLRKLSSVTCRILTLHVTHLVTQTNSSESIALLYVSLKNQFVKYNSLVFQKEH